MSEIAESRASRKEEGAADADDTARVAAIFGADNRLARSRRAATLSAQIVEQIRLMLFDGVLRPGDFLGTEKDVADRFAVSRAVARDAMRTLEAMGIADIRVGAGGGALISRGDPMLFADALSVQLKLRGVRVGDVMEVQHAIECLAAEAAARNAGPAATQRLSDLLEGAETLLSDADAFTRAAHDFHVAVAEASGNPVVAIQSLRHVTWPARNRTLTRDVAERVQAYHREIFDRIAAGDTAGARDAMARHVDQIAARRMAEAGETPERCC